MGIRCSSVILVLDELRRLKIIIDNNIWDILENNCPGMHLYFFQCCVKLFKAVVCLNYSGLCAVTFFSHSALPSLSCLLISPKCRVLCVLFFGIGGNWQGREEQRWPSETWENEMRWLFILPAKATYLFRVALERGLKQHQRPCTQITRLALRRRLDGRMGGWKSGVPTEE